MRCNRTTRNAGGSEMQIRCRAISPAKPSHSHARKVMAQNGSSGDMDAPPQGDSGMVAPIPVRQLNWTSWSKRLTSFQPRCWRKQRSGSPAAGTERCGCGLRGDMVERQAGLKPNLFKAEGRNTTMQ
jgi:hypothetical protein